MAIQESEVKVGAYYCAGGKGNQLKKVTDIFEDEKQRKRVYYESKSIRIRARPFRFGTAKSNPPFISTFCNSCIAVLSDSEVSELRRHNIILLGE